MKLSLQMIAFYISITTVVNQDAVTYRKGVCACEELNEKECLSETSYIEGRCDLVKGKCKSRRCEDIQIIFLCRYIDCQVKGSKCQNVQSCNDQTEEECKSAFNYECIYDSYLKRCVSLYDPIPDETIPTCAERPIDQCFIGREGLCNVKNNQCQELTVCENVTTDQLCYKTYPACLMNPSISCTTDDKCEDSANPTCKARKLKINGNQYIICKELEDGSCVNFDPSQENEETCYTKSQLFYHWDGKSCVKCKGSQASAQQVTIYILFILLLYNL